MNSTTRVASGLAKVAVVVEVSAVAVIALLFTPTAALAATPQDRVHRMSHHTTMS